MKELVEEEEELMKNKGAVPSDEALLKAKQDGFSDKYLSKILEIPEDDSPVLKSANFAGGRGEMDFDHVKGWHVYAPNRSRDAAFEVAGTNGVWTAAKIVNYRQAKGKDGKPADTDFIDGTKIAVKADTVAAPVKVRYLHEKPWRGNLYAASGVPLGPFEVAK